MTDFPAGTPRTGATGATGSRDVVSVAELLARHAAASRDARRPDGPATGPVLSVGDLLRREGQTAAVPTTAVPAATDVPATGAPGGWPDIDLPQPREATPAAGGWAAAGPMSGRKRAGAVAGALVAAGSVLGAALYNGAATHESDAQAAADGLFPGVALPADEAPETLPGQYLPANVALSSPLEAPQAPPVPQTAPGASDWMSVAFPVQQAPSAAAGTLRRASTGTGSGAAAAVPPPSTTTAAAAPTAPGDGAQGSISPTPTGTGGTGATGTGSPLGGLAPVRALNNPERSSAGNVIEPLGYRAPTEDTPSTGPLQDGTEALRPSVRTVTGAVAPVTEATRPVGDTVGAVAKPLTRSLSPVTDTVTPVTRPVADTLEPVTTPVLGALSPVSGPVLETTEPLTGPVLDAAEPVTGLLDTSAKKDGDSASSSEGGSTTKASAKKSSGGGDSTRPLKKVTGLTGSLFGSS